MWHMIRKIKCHFFKNMNFLSKKLIVAFFVVMLGINLNMPKADAVNHCEGQLCLTCNGMMIAAGKSTPILMFAGHDRMCQASIGNTTCSLKKNPQPNAQIFIVSSLNVDQQKTGGSFAFAIFGTSLLQNVSKKGSGGHFQITTDTIPIYLKNLSFLC
jgi:hypothetical protein